MYATPAIVFDAPIPVRTIVPAAVSVFVHEVFCVLPVPPDLDHDKRIIPPALKKYLNWSLLANVNVFDSVELVFQLLVDTELTDESDPEPAAFNFPLYVAVMFALNAA